MNPLNLPRTSNGFTSCRWCKGDVHPPRRTFCSKSCVHEHLLRANNKYMRNQVYARDKGVCSMCSVDCKLVAKQVQLHGRVARDKYGISAHRRCWKTKLGGGLWDVDHIVPVFEGGGQCGLENLQTLCIPCHKRKTQQQRRKRTTKT